MAIIKIEKKKLFWTWILFALGIITVFVYLMSLNPVKEELAVEPQTNEVISDKENNAAVMAFVEFIESDTNSMSLDHAFTREALLKLFDATNALANEIGYDVNTDMEKIVGFAEVIIKDPLDTSHADSIRKATDILSDVLLNIQKAEYPELLFEVAELKNASASINPDVLTLNQKHEVKSFFRKAADLLRKMNELNMKEKL